MVPQGSQTLNADYFAALTKRINDTNVCADLQDLVADATASINSVKSAIGSELAFLSPILDLLENPGADLGKIATWIEKFIGSFLSPYSKSQASFLAQLTQLETEIAGLVSAIAAKAAEIENCTVSTASLV